MDAVGRTTPRIWDEVGEFRACLSPINDDTKRRSKTNQPVKSGVERRRRSRSVSCSVEDAQQGLVAVEPAWLAYLGLSLRALRR